MTLANVALTDTFDIWRTRTNQLVVQSNFYEVNLPNYTYANNIGVSANAYANLVGQGANSYMLTVQNGSNTAIGAGANAYANLVGAGANSYMLTVQNGSNTAVGLGANTYTNAFGILVGQGANAYASVATNLTSGTVPSARMSGSYTGITGVGTVTTGVWNATDVSLAAGGTNASLTASAGAVAYSTASALALSGVGTSGQVLTSTGASAPIWTSILPSGTAMLFAQATAPTGWTKSATHDNKALRVVTGATGGSSGGTVGFTTAFSSKAVSGTIGQTTATGTIGQTTATGTVGSTVLNESQIPPHTHTYSNKTATTASNFDRTGLSPGVTGISGASTAGGSTGGGLGHDHPFTGTAHGHTFTGDSHNHTFTGTAIDMAVQYVDVIIATKD